MPFREELLHGRAWPLRLVGSGSVLCAVKRYTRTCKFLFTDCVCNLESYQSKFFCEKGGVECLHAKLAHEFETLMRCILKTGQVFKIRGGIPISAARASVGGVRPRAKYG